MRLIIGLGNPSDKYKNTRHNLGFIILEKIAQKRKMVFRSKSDLETELAESRELKLAKPQTFMNESGRAVLKVKNYFKIDSEDIWVIYDEVDLEPGTLRINFAGTSAGHKGVESVITNIGDNFWRLRVGIGKSDTIPTDKWVLKKFSEIEKQRLDRIIDTTADYVINLLGKEIKEDTIRTTNNL